MFQTIIGTISDYAVPLIILLIPLYGLLKGVKIYEVFIEGAKEGFYTAVRIMPYLVAMLFAVGIVRETGVLNMVTSLLSPLCSAVGIPSEVLPLGFMRTLSGGGAQAMLAEILGTYGADSKIGLTASIAMGSTETTLYVIAVYYGSIGISRTRHTLPVCLTSDAVSLLAAAFISNLIF